MHLPKNLADEALNRTEPDAVICAHIFEIVPISTDHGVAYALRIVGHRSPSDRAAEEVSSEDVIVYDMGVSPASLSDLVAQVFLATSELN